MMKIFVTGATGFIGRNLARRLTEEGHEVICGIRSPARAKLFLPAGAKSARIYLEHKETISRILTEERPDAVYHCAALVESRSIKNLRRVNRDGTKNVLEACLEAGVKKVIYLSTIAVASGNPEVPLTEDLPLKARNPYGLSKLEAEKVALEYRKKGLKIAIIRPTMVYGEGEPHALAHIIKGLKRRVIPIFGKGEKKLHLVSVENVVDVLIFCLSKEEAYKGSFFVADKEVLTVGEILNYVASAAGAKPPLIFPRWIADVLAKVPILRGNADIFTRDMVYSIDRLREELGYVPRVSVYDGLKRAVVTATCPASQIRQVHRLIVR